MLTTAVFSGAAGEECECGTNATQIELMVGEEDNFDSDSDTPPASPSQALADHVNSNNLTVVGFDNSDTNKEFIHTFEWDSCGNINKACLEVRLKALPNSFPPIGSTCGNPV